jgi:predicted protein tyrosine phosphatase
VNILVCPLSRVNDVATQWKPIHVISLLDPEHPFPTVTGVSPSRHLRLAFHDAHFFRKGVTLPTREHLRDLLTFLEGCSPTDRLLIHCRAGIGRSTAAAFIVACHQYPAVSELEIAQTLRRVAPLARPNETFVKVADDVMARGGRMSDAIAETGRDLPWIDVAEGDVFELVIADTDVLAR